MSVVAERKLVILNYVGKTPTLATCTKCERKFFTPNFYYCDPLAAGEYLEGKFDRHDCEHELQKAQGLTNASAQQKGKPRWDKPGL